MNRFISLFSMLTILLSVSAVAPVQTAEYGRIDRTYIYSPQMGDTITVDTWVPDGYDKSTERYPVIYMHDGQNLFDANTTWNHQAWEMDRAMGRLIAADSISPAIIVGIHSFQDTRVADLMPRKAVSGTPLEATLDMVKLKGRRVRGDEYASFIVETLKPAIDSTYRTLPDAPNTTVMGSSMGGLMSIYALCEYPRVFGNALCLSTHWVGSPDVADQFSDAMYRYIDAKVPAEGHRLYFDHGDATIDAYYGPHEERILALLRHKGYGHDRLKSLYAPGAAHCEDAWAARVHIPLIFLLGK